MPRKITNAILGAASTLALLGATPAWSGAWPRGAGNHFASMTLRFPVGAGAQALPETSLFYEYGVSKRMTLGLDMGLRGNATESALLTVSYAPSVPWEGTALTLTVGGGVVADAPVLRSGASLGRGFSVRELSGWAQAEAMLDYRPLTGLATGKLDLTLGFNLGPTAQVYGQVFVTAPQGEETTVRLEASYAHRISDSTRLDLGLSSDPSGQTPKLKLGVWMEF